MYISFALKFLLKRNMGTSEKAACGFFVQLYWDPNCYLFNILNGCHHWKWFKGIVSVGNMMKQEKLRFVQLYWKLLSSWTLLLECFETNFVSVCQLWPENSEGKCGQSEEAYAGFCYLLNILDRHLSLEMFQKKFSGFLLQFC